jgi:hypothetical protein
VRYALAGVPILPIYDVRDGRCACPHPDECARTGRAGKHPRLPNGVTGASASVDLVRRWWTWWPSANVGAATGHRFDVWDIDLPDADDLLTGYLGDQVGAWPMTRTGSGGTHVFVAPTGQGNRGKFLPDCDWRGRGGYVVLPPSGHATGQTYRWLTPATDIIRPAPVGLLRALVPQPSRATPARGWHASHASGYAHAAIRRECDPVAAMAPDSGRNHALNRAAFNLGQLVAGGLVDEATVTDALTDAARSCELPDREAARTIASGLRAGQRHPRTRRGAA